MIPDLLGDVAEFEIVVSLVGVIVTDNGQAFGRIVLLNLWKNYTISVVN